MRIGFVIYGNLRLVSGGFIYDRSLIDALVALGHRVEVVALPWVGYRRALLGSLCARPVPTPPTAWDVVIEDELVHPSLVRRPALWRPRGDAGVPISQQPPSPPPRVGLIHNLGCLQPAERHPHLKGLVERAYLRALDGVIAVCDDTLAGARRLAGRRLLALVAHPGRSHIDPDASAADRAVGTRTRRDGPLRVLHVAAVVPHKGLDRLIRSLAPLPAADCQLDVVGDPTRDVRYTARLKSLIAVSGLAGRVRWHGQIQGPALWRVFADSHLFALPSDREAYSLACLEAMGFGLPVLATGRGGLAEMFAGADAGLLLDPHDLSAWTAALRSLSADRARLAAMGQAARQRFLAHQTWAQVAITVQEFLARIVDRSRTATLE